MTAKRITRRLTRIAAFILGFIVVLLAVFHFWFINHAKSLIEDIVEKQSKGKLHLSIGKFRFNWMNRKMELRNAVFYSTDTATASTANRLRVDRIQIQVKEILPLIFDKKFYIDSIKLVNPEITVTKLRPKDTLSAKDTSLSIPQEMGRIYNSIQDALQVLQVDRFQIDNGTFTLINRVRPEEKPITISRLNFHLDNLQVTDPNKTENDSKILFSDNVVLQTTHQNILFPDGRHRLIFSNFRINILNRLAEFDSCTIIATKGDSAGNSFRIFFDKLRMTNIDFDTLYHTEVIKADSVYCINPRFRLDVDLPKRTGPVKPPKLDELIQQLTGNIQLGFVVVQNGSFDINTLREGRPSSFTSDHNNFELRGLRIQENAQRPLTVEGFAIAIRNYETFLRDSAYTIRFDSIRFNNNRISLNNFSYQETRNNKVINNLSMPRFELQGLSWDNLVFEQQLNAEKVTLYRPVISYNLVRNRNRPSQDVFQVLAGIGSSLQLSNVDIIDGKVDLLLEKNARLQLEGANMSVRGKELVGSRGLTSIRKAVDELHFSKGIFTAGDLTMRLENVQFKGGVNGLSAGTVYLRNKTMAIDAKGVTIESMLSDDRLQQTTIRGMQWQQADVRIMPGGKAGAPGSLVVEKIRGANTKIVVDQDMRKASVFLERISVDAFRSVPGRPLQLSGLVAAGRDLSVADSALLLTVKALNIADGRSSTLQEVAYTSYTPNDSVHITVPALSLVPDINAMLRGAITADAVTVSRPVITISLRHTDTAGAAGKNSIGSIAIGRLRIVQPVVQYRSTTPKGISRLEWSGNINDNYIDLANLALNSETGSAAVGQLRFSMDHFRYTDPKGKAFNAGKGEIEAQVNQLAWHTNADSTRDWTGTLAYLAARQFIIDSLDLKGGTLTIDSARLSDLSISSATLPDFRRLVSNNTRFHLYAVTGSYHNADEQYHWYNAGYNRLTKHFSLDSFTYRPAAEQEAFLNAQTFQTDYMAVRTGRVDIGPFDIYRYIQDSIMELGIVTIHDGYLYNFRDKRLPRPPGVIRHLPVNLVKKIPVMLEVDTVHIINANVDYGELNEKTGAEGTITVNRLQATVTNLRNFDIAEHDSLLIRASAYLQDTMLTRLQVKESYTDSLAGFLMTAQMGPADLTVLNPVLAPMAGAELRSGKLDTMTLRVVGREYLAFGSMNMYYHDLKVKIKRPDGKRSFVNGIITFVANTLIKNENRDRTGTVFFQRLRDRSAINYLVKIALSGVTSSVGVKRNKKQVRRYRKEIRSRNLPLIEAPSF
ncbi:MAG: hypothetical protein ABW019_03825 [Chitinophagaceae bacterium]